VNLVIQSGEPIVIVLGFKGVGIFCGNAEVRLRLINARNVVSETRRQDRRLSASNPLIVKKEESSILHDRATQRRSKLILSQRKWCRAGLQQRSRIDRAVLEIFVNGSVQIIRA